MLSLSCKRLVTGRTRLLSAGRRYQLSAGYAPPGAHTIKYITIVVFMALPASFELSAINLNVCIRVSRPSIPNMVYSMNMIIIMDNLCRCNMRRFFVHTQWLAVAPSTALLPSAAGLR